MRQSSLRTLLRFTGLPTFVLACSDPGSQSGQTSFSTGTGVSSQDEVGDGDGEGEGESVDDGDGDLGGGGEAGECSEGEEQCKADTGHRVCSGGMWTPQPCADGSYCDEQSDSCITCVCVPGEPSGCADASNVEVCSADCSGYQPQPCLGGVCLDGACIDLVCVPGQLGCADSDSVRACNNEGTAWSPPEDCEVGEACYVGKCVSACELATTSKSNLGCEFWAVDMENLPPRDRYTYAVAISNPSFDDPAVVAFWDANGGV
ncbi:MAG TPA: hypothetical protein VM869_12075, partial [Enhygromyxa sp.]|nr:hypothetical protein [Enhygromyxa sp.]